LRTGRRGLSLQEGFDPALKLLCLRSRPKIEFLEHSSKEFFVQLGLLQ
jgi:hypothetical protein